jgi:hypothetical protein
VKEIKVFKNHRVKNTMLHEEENQFHVTRSDTTLGTNANIECFLYTHAQNKRMFIEAKNRYFLMISVDKYFLIRLYALKTYSVSAIQRD